MSELVIGRVYVVGNAEYEPLMLMRFTGFADNNAELAEFQGLENSDYVRQFHRGWGDQRWMALFSDAQYAEIERMIAEAKGKGS